MQILQDIKTAVRLTSAVRTARKAGADAIQVTPVFTVPRVTFAPAYYNTIEGCLTHRLGHDINRAVMDVFKGLPYETQRQLEFTPEEPGGWAERARFWQRQLKPALPPKNYHSVMALFINWYAHCLRREAGAAL